MNPSLTLLALTAVATARPILAQTPEPPTAPPAVEAAPAARTSDLTFTIHATDGTTFDAKLTLPDQRPAPVVFYLHGAGPRTYDNNFRYADADGQVKVGSYLEYYSSELARRRIAFCRICKRGCTPTKAPPFLSIDREVFSRATLTVLVDDYAQALKALRDRPEIDPARIVLVGSSEGTRAAPLLAKRSPDGIVAVVMMGYAADNARKTVEWQNTIGPWRNIQHLIPAARDGELTRAEFDELAKTQPALARAVPFASLDPDGDGKVRSGDLERLNVPRLDAINKAVQDKDDEFLWKNLLNLSSAYLMDWWDAKPNVQNLLALDVPLAIFHGDLDGACRVEGVHETQGAFLAAGRTNLTVHTYADANHDLNWTWRSLTDGGPQPYRDAFDFIAQHLR